MTVLQRVQSPTPKFFKTVRNGGLIMATLGATLLATPASVLPPWLLKLAGYMAVAGTVATAVSQATTGSDDPQNGDTHGT